MDLIEKLEGHCELIQSNTDGVLLKFESDEDMKVIIDICNKWETRTGFELEFDEYSTIIQSNVNNYIIIDQLGHIKRKGAIVKELSKLDNNLPIVNKAIVDYFVNNIPVEKTILSSNNMMDFQQITKAFIKYEFAPGKEEIGKHDAYNYECDGIYSKFKIKGNVHHEKNL